MKLSLNIIVVVAIAGLVLLIACLPLVRSRHICTKAQSCSVNLKTLWLGLQLYSEDNAGVLPDNLSNLTTVKGFNSNLEYFICPSTHQTPGNVKEIDQWTAYSYLSSLEPNAIVLYCPPENHFGEYGRIVFFDGKVKQVNSEEFSKILSEQNITYAPKRP